MLRAVESVNNRQKHRPFELLSGHFNGNVQGLTVALWGLSFKPNTDDMREAPSLNLIDAILAGGGSVRAHDPEAGSEALRFFSDRPGFTLVDDPYEAARNADALVLITEWKLYWAPDFDRLKREMKQAVIVDGRNIWSPEVVRRRGSPIIQSEGRKNLMSKTALITGITGQDGAYLAEFLLKKGYEVHGIKRRASLINTARIDHLYSDPHVENARLVLHYGDMTDSSSLQRTIQRDATG